MDEPLGYAVGNSLEVIEAINFLKGNMPKDLKDVVLELGANMLQLAGKGENIEENKLKINWPRTNTCNAIHVWIEVHSREQLSFGYADKSVWWMPWH